MNSSFLVVSLTTSIVPHVMTHIILFTMKRLKPVPWIILHVGWRDKNEEKSPFLILFVEFLFPCSLQEKITSESERNEMFSFWSLFHLENMSKSWTWIRQITMLHELQVLFEQGRSNNFVSIWFLAGQSSLTDFLNTLILPSWTKSSFRLRMISYLPQLRFFPTIKKYPFKDLVTLPISRIDYRWKISLNPLFAFGKEGFITD